MKPSHNNTGIFLPSGCLSESGMDAYFKGKIQDQDREKIHRHLNDCELCRLAAKGLESASASLDLAAENSKLHQQIDRLAGSRDTSPAENVKLPDNRGSKGMIRYLRDLRNIAAILPLLLLLGSVLWLTAALQMVDHRISGISELLTAAGMQETQPRYFEEGAQHSIALTPPPPKLAEFRIEEEKIIIEDDFVFDIEEDFVVAHDPMVQITEFPETEETEIFIVVEEPPVFPGGHEAMFDYLAKNLRYPPQAREEAVQGVVYLTFVIHTDGSIGDVKVLRGVHRLLDEEAVRVISAMPSWVPGKQRGKPVRVQFTMPVKFALK